MSELAHPDRERLLELLSDQAVQGLSGEEQTELGRLLAAHDDAIDDESLDRAAAAIDLSLGPVEFEPLPAELADRIRNSAREHLPAEPTAPVETGDSGQPAPASMTTKPVASSARRSVREVAALLVAAACLVIAAVSLWSDGPVDLAEQRQRLISEANDEITVAWAAQGDPSGPMAGGDVVWSTAQQRGFMRIRGLSPNKPEENQYQLWIFDKNRDARYPVDGGVFDVKEGAEEVIVAIDAKIAVDDPTLFAITVERPGGVVVSDRERLPLLAEVSPTT